MAVVSWGAPTLQFIPVTAGGSAPASGSWSSVTGFIEIKGDVLLEDSSQLSTTAGEKKELRNEKGVIVDSKQMPATYQFTSSIIKKKSETAYPSMFGAVNGVVNGNYAMRLIAEDPATPGFEMRMVTVSFSKSWSADQGALDVITVDGVEPNFSGDTDHEICSDYFEDTAYEKMRHEYLTFTAGEDGADIMFYCPEEEGTTVAVSISTDGGQTWTQKESSYDGTLLASLSAGQKMLVKGTNDAIGYYSNDEDEYLGNYFYSEDKYFVSGNIMSLLYGDSFADKFHLSQENERAFCRLFSDYWEERIENAVDINPAAPLVLPATTLARYCYASMFNGCTGLTSAPELPATTLAGSCYYSMFNGCTGLTIAPELPATTLESSCYRGMFRGCTSLNYVKCLATNISATSSHTNWLEGVAATGTFVKAAGMTSWPTGISGIPTGWTVQEAS